MIGEADLIKGYSLTNIAKTLELSNEVGVIQAGDKGNKLEYAAKACLEKNSSA